MTIDENLEQRLAESRGRVRQDKKTPFLIRDDGLLFPNVPLIAAKKNFRPYHGDIAADLAQRRAYLLGQPSTRRVVATKPAADEPPEFDVSKATKDELVQFALDEFGTTLDPALHMNKLRAEVCRLAGIEPSKVFGPHGGKAPKVEEPAA